MKQYPLMSPEQLEAAWKNRHRKELFDMGDTLTKIREFFASRDPGGGKSGERRTEGDRGKERGPAGG